MGGFFFIGLILLVIEIDSIENTMNGMRLVWTAVSVGFIISLFFLLYLSSLKSITNYDKFERRAMYFSLSFSFMAFTTALASYVNHSYTEEQVYLRKVELVRTGVSSGRYTAYWLFVKNSENKVERFKASKEFLSRISDNKIIVFYTKMGKLGYEIVVDFKTERELKSKQK